MATPEEQLGAAVAEQIRQMQAESQGFSPVNEKLKEAQDAILQGLLKGSPKQQQAVHPLAGNEDFQWVVQQLTMNPLVIPYFRQMLEKTLVKLKTDIENSIKQSLGL